jgi:hypothetical protein
MLELTETVAAREEESELRRLTTDLWFFWDGDEPRPPTRLDVHLVTVNGTIAGAYPRSVSKGELLPIHRKYVPTVGTGTFYLRIAAGAVPVRGLSVAVELRDHLGRGRSVPLCQLVGIEARGVLAIEVQVEIPEELG